MKDYFFIGILTGIFISIIMQAIVSIYNIKPIDVYKGNTTLKYEVVDGVKVDSIVV